MNDLKSRLIRYMDAGFPILYLHTFEEDKADKLIRSVASGRGILDWNIKGFFDHQDHISQPGQSLVETLNLLTSLNKSLDRKVLVLKDTYNFLDDPTIVALLKNIALRINQGLDECTIIIVSPMVKLPKDLENFMTILTIDHLSTEEIRQVIVSFCEEQKTAPLKEELREELTVAFKGLSEFEIRNILALALSENGEIAYADLKLIFEQKQQVIEKSGILEMIPLKESLEDVGGLENLKKWLHRKERVFKNIDKAEAYGVDVPKGVLIAGMPGCGKSLNAKAAAHLFRVPLLRLDMGRLMGKYVGESEENMRKAISLAEAISSCVLWIDELEKAFAGIGGDGGGADITTRLFGTFLTWLQEKKSLAFVVATANNIEKMPPELLRKGRFDEIFFVGLPNRKEREKIFEIHIKKRRKDDYSKIDIQALVAKTDGYSGADIEGVVKDSVEEAFYKEKSELTTEDILEAIKATHSLSEIMKDSLDKMSKMYKERKFKNASDM